MSGHCARCPATARALPFPNVSYPDYTAGVDIRPAVLPKSNKLI